MSTSSLTEEQRRKIEENKRKALAKRAEKLSPIKQAGSVQQQSFYSTSTKIPEKADSLKLRAEQNRQKALDQRKAFVSRQLAYENNNSDHAQSLSLSGNEGASHNNDVTGGQFKHSNDRPTSSATFSAAPYGFTKNNKAGAGSSQLPCPQMTKPDSVSRMPSAGTHDSHTSGNRKGMLHANSEQKLKGKCVMISSDMFSVEVGWSAPLIEYFKSLTTRRYDLASKNWSFKLTEYNTFMNGLANFQPHIQIEGLPRWILQAFGTDDVTTEIVPEADLSHVDEKLVQTLLPFQREGVNTAIHRNGKLLLADDMGLGKTLQAICIARYYHTEWPLLIVSPSSVRHDWAQQIIKWLPSIPPCEVNIVDTGQTKATSGFINIISYDLLSKKVKELKERMFKIIIMDESHFLKNFKTARTKAAMPLLKSARRILLLSGTPALSRPSELFCQITAVCPDLFRTFHEFGLRYCNAKVNPWGWDYSGSSNMLELQLLLEKKVMIRRQKKDVLSQLPAKTRNMIVLDPRLVERYKDLEVTSKLVVKAKQSGLDRRGALLQYFQATCKAKLSSVRDYVLDLLEGGRKFLVFGHHKEMLDCIEDCIKSKMSNIEYIRIDGRTSSEQRNFFCSKFQTSDNYRVAILSITAANAGLNLSAANVVVFAELFWNPGILVQAEDRAHRIGQHDSVSVQYLVAKETADDYIWPLIQGKLDVLNKAGLTKDDFSNADTTRLVEKGQQTLLDMFSTDFIDDSAPNCSHDLEGAESDSDILVSQEEKKLGSVEDPAVDKDLFKKTPKKSRSARGSQRTSSKQLDFSSTSSPSKVSPSKRQATITSFFETSPVKRSRRDDEDCGSSLPSSAESNVTNTQTSNKDDLFLSDEDDFFQQKAKGDDRSANALSQEDMAAMEEIDWDEMM